MDILLNLGLFALALTVLLKGSDFFIDAAEKIGLSLGISPFVIGVTIVAAGTSLPELAASIVAVLDGNPEIVVGTVVGSNIANILLVLGTVAIVAKYIRMDYNVMDVDMPLLVCSALLLWYVLYDSVVSIPEALVLIAGLIIFLITSFSSSEKDESIRPKAGWKAYAMLAVGGVMIYFGADYTVLAITRLAEAAGIGQGVVALTLVALGTSLPEVVVSIAAARKGKPGIAVGNVLGSNIFNTYAVIGIPSLIAPLTVPEDISAFGLPFMLGVTFLFAIVSVSNRISRWEGVMLLLFYAFFMVKMIESAV